MNALLSQILMKEGIRRSFKKFWEKRKRMILNIIKKTATINDL